MTSPRDEDYLTTAEVAARLKVKQQTVYAYVSRGILTSVRARGRRGSLFARAEVDRLADRSVDHQGAIERIASGLTSLDGDELVYRGHRATDLVTSHSVEAVAQLLWTGSLPAEALSFPAPAEQVELARAAMAAAPAQARLTDQLRIAVAVLGAGDPLRFDLTPAAVQRSAARLLGVLVAALPGPSSDGSFGARLWPKLAAPDSSSAAPGSPSAAARDASADDSERPPAGLLDAAVILLADHGLAVSTLAARVAASTRANLYAVVSAALGALDGPLHGAAITLAHELLAEALTDPVDAVSRRLRSGRPLPGFGHRVYRDHDPRAEALLTLLGDTPATRAVQAVARHTPLFPNSDLAVAALLHTHALRPDAGEALFALARVIGWTAHALEEYAQPALRFRALGTYTGHHPTPAQEPR